MNAMILAAGPGTRLRPITDRIPKVLVPVDGVPILERIARRLVQAGADRLVVNVHHEADQIERFLDGWGLDVEVALSREPDGPLGTGGGLRRAADLLRGDGPFLLHVGDVLSDLDLGALVAAQHAGDAITTLAVLERPTSRFLLFDDAGLYGWENEATGGSKRVRDPAGTALRIPFSGVHAIDPALLDRITETGVFSIIDVYLRLAAEGEAIRPHDVSGARWVEIGNPERLEEARRAVAAEPDAFA